MVACGVAACGGASSYVAKVGSTRITKAQLQAVLKLGNTLPSPKPSRAENRLLQEQALDFLAQQTLAHLVDAKLGIKPENQVVTDASFRKVTGDIRISDREVRAEFARNRKRYPVHELDLGTATSIRSQLLEKRRAVAMHAFVTEAERRWPVTYATGFKPVSEMALAREIWKLPPSSKPCDLPGGTYPYQQAWAHNCVEAVPIPGQGSPACALIDFPSGPSGFSSAEENDGYAEYVADNGDTCSDDPRLVGIQVESRPNHTPVSVSYVHASGVAAYKHPLLDFTLRYPRRFHVQQVSYGGVESVDGVEVANYPLGQATAGRPLSRGGVDFTFTSADFEATSVSSGPLISRPPTRAPTIRRLPLRITDADLAAGRYQTEVSADGMILTLTIATGSSPSRQDIDALRAMAASIQFPRLRVGEFTPNNLYVLGRSSAYPLGSVTEFPAGFPLPYYKKLRSGRFYLEHTADGYWTITWPSNYLHGYKACGPHFDAATRRFTCPSGAVWDLQGRVVKNPDPRTHVDDPLERTQARVADGYVLVPLSPPPG